MGFIIYLFIFFFNVFMMFLLTCTWVWWGRQNIQNWTTRPCHTLKNICRLQRYENKVALKYKNKISRKKN